MRRAQLQAEEERQREAMAKRSSHVGGSVPMFRLGGLGFGHRHEQQQQQPSTAVGGQSGSSVGTDNDSNGSSKPDQSWVQWVGSWIGWK